MKLGHATGFRPNFALGQGLIWLLCGAAAFALITAGLGLAPGQALWFTAHYPLIALACLLRAAQHSREARRRRRGALQFLSLAALTRRMRPGHLYLGTGFDWTAACAQKVADLYHDHAELDAIRAAGQGATFLHGLGPGRESPIELSDEETKGHTLIIGTTGAGKTRLFDLLVSQSVLRGEATIIVDPKGDQDLMRNCAAAFARAGRAGAFSFFHPAFPEHSCAIDPLANYQRESELASRIAAIIPGEGDSEVFRSYSQNALMSLFYGIIAGGRPPTLLDIHQPLTQGSAHIVARAILRWAERAGPDEAALIRQALAAGQDPDKAARAAARLYKAAVAAQEGLRDHDLDGLIGLFEHDATHFSKMVASLIPVIGQLCSGPLKQLLSPSTQHNRLPRSGRVINLADVVRGRQGLYIGLDTLSDAIVGARIGQLVLSDLTALAGAQYNFGGERQGFVNIFVDEAAEVVTDKLIQLLNKGRGAGFRLFVATQTLADLEARAGSAAIRDMMVGNLNAVIMLRTINPETQKALADQLPEVPITTIMKSAATTLGADALDAAFGVSHGERLMQEDRPMIQPQTFGDLTDLEYFVRTPRGRLLKGRLPILRAPQRPDPRPPILHAAETDRPPETTQPGIASQRIGPPG